MIRAIVLLSLVVHLASGQEVPSIESMTLEQKIGQLMFPAVHPDRAIPGAPEWERLKGFVSRYHVGGVHVFRSTSAQMSSLINRVQAAATIPALVTADFEGGTGWIVRDGVRLPRGLGLAATGDRDLVRRVGRLVAQEGRRVGVHVNFFPVLDVNNNPANPIINTRAFGDRPGQVARFGVAYLKGLQEGGMLATAKHFPGHGDTETDSHLALPVVSADRTRLDAIELPPFRAAFDAGVACVMSAHIAWPAVTGEQGVPATLSKAILTGLLREEMGFEGICFTDALDMQGITRNMSPAEASIRAVLAGADALLFTQDVPGISRALAAAVRSGRVPEKRIDSACGRILAAKRRLGKTIARPGQALDPESDARKQLVRAGLESVRRSLTLLRAAPAVYPVRQTRGKDLLHVAVTDQDDPWDWESPVEGAVARFARSQGRRATAQVPDAASARRLGQLLGDEASNADTVIVTVATGLGAVRGKSGLSAEQVDLIRQLAGPKSILVLLGNPYGFPLPEGYGTVLIGYDLDRTHGEQAMAAVFGDFHPAGRLPIDLPGFGSRGDGMVKSR